MQFSGPRILVVDDEPTILFALREYLSTCGFVIECAENLETALAKLAAQSFALVIADLSEDIADSHARDILKRAFERLRGCRESLACAIRGSCLGEAAQH